MESELQNQMKEYLGPKGGSPGILQRHGRVLMSGWDTVRPGPYYVVGINPGGGLIESPPYEETIDASLSQHPENWNYFADDDAVGRHAQAVLPVFDRLGTQPKSTLTTNAVFLRSSSQSTLPEDALTVWLDHCRHVHDALIMLVQPRVVVCFGIGSWTYMTGRGDPGRWGFFSEMSLQLGNDARSCGVLLLPHFSLRAARSWTNYASTLEQAQLEARAHAHAP